MIRYALKKATSSLSILLAIPLVYVCTKGTKSKGISLKLCFAKRSSFKCKFLVVFLLLILHVFLCRPHALLSCPSQQRKRATERQEIAREARERAEGEERPGDRAAQRNGLSCPLPVSQHRPWTALPHPRGHQLLQLHHQTQTGHPRGHHELPECQE